MTPDNINLILRLMILFVLTPTIEISLQKKLYGLGIFTSGIWFDIFRQALLRATTAYTGVFSHEEGILVDSVTNFLRASLINNALDFVILIGAICLFFCVVRLKVKQVNQY